METRQQEMCGVINILLKQIPTESLESLNLSGCGKRLTHSLWIYWIDIAHLIEPLPEDISSSEEDGEK